MGLKRKQVQMRQKVYFEQKLQSRLSFLSEKGVEAPKIDKDPLVKKLRASIRAVNNRLRLIADNEKRTEEVAKIKVASAAAALKEQEGGKVEKLKKAPMEGKEKKMKGEKKAAPPKAQEGDKSQKAAEAPEDDKTKLK